MCWIAMCWYPRRRKKGATSGWHLVQTRKREEGRRQQHPATPFPIGSSALERESRKDGCSCGGSRAHARTRAVERGCLGLPSPRLLPLPTSAVASLSLSAKAVRGGRGERAERLERELLPCLAGIRRQSREGSRARACPPARHRATPRPARAAAGRGWVATPCRSGREAGGGASPRQRREEGRAWSARFIVAGAERGKRACFSSSRCSFIHCPVRASVPTDGILLLPQRSLGIVKGSRATGASRERNRRTAPPAAPVAGAGAAAAAVQGLCCVVAPSLLAFCEGCRGEGREGAESLPSPRLGRPRSFLHALTDCTAAPHGNNLRGWGSPGCTDCVETGRPEMSSLTFHKFSFLLFRNAAIRFK